MLLNNKFVRIVITGLLSTFLVVITAYAASSDTKAEMDLVKAQMNEQQEIMDRSHDMAEHARFLGEDEQSEVILTAKEYYHQAKDVYDNLSAQYNKLSDKYNKELADEKKKQEQSKGRLIGTFRISRYCPCSICNGGYTGTATGTTVTAGRTIAVDPSVIPLGSKVYIEGIGYRWSEDTGGAIRGNRIDLAVSSHSQAYAEGISYNKVYIVQ